MVNLIKSKILTKELLDDILASDEAIIISFLNPVSYCLLRSNKRILDEIDYFGIDGLMLVKFIEYFDISNPERMSFDMTSLAPMIFNHSIKKDKGIYFIGSREKEIQSTIRVIKNSFPSIRILGYRDGFFKNETEKIYTIKEIEELNPDFVIVGMGAVLQESFLIQLKNNTSWRGIGFTCGGFLHQTAQGIQYYPDLINKYHLRMPYRLIKEKLYTRLHYYPLFISSFLRDMR